MKWINVTVLSLLASALLAACGAAPSENRPLASNSSTTTANGTSKPVALAPSKDDLIANEKKAWASWKAKDGKYFEDYLTDTAFGMGGKGRANKAAIVKRISDPTCEVTDFTFAEEQLRPLGADVALLTYKATQDAKCGGNALPRNVWAATVLVRNGDRWKAAYHNEVTITDPQKAVNTLKEFSEKPTYIAAKYAVSDNATEAMLAAEKLVWNAWKDHDGKKLEELTAKDISFINIFGTFFANKADAIKDWSATGCQVKSVSVSDAVGTMLSSDVGILTFKGGADGTCFGQKVPPIWGTSIYVKEGDTWKWAFGMNISSD